MPGWLCRERIGDIAGKVLGIAAEHPADVGMKQPAEHVDESRAVMVRGMGIAVRVAVLMMAAVHRDPFEDRAFNRHGTHDAEDEFDKAAGFKGAMAEEAVIADSDAQGDEQVHADEEAEVEPVKSAAPEHDDAGDQSREGSEDRDKIDDALEIGGLVVFRLRVESMAGTMGGAEITVGSWERARSVPLYL